MTRLKVTSALATIVILVTVLSGCMKHIAVMPDAVNNISPEVVGGAFHSPNGEEQHNQYEWDLYGYGDDIDGEIVSWIIRINGETFRVGNNPDPEFPWQSERVRYQFPGKGEYLFSVTAIDNNGAVTTWECQPNGYLPINY